MLGVYLYQGALVFFFPFPGVRTVGSVHCLVPLLRLMQDLSLSFLLCLVLVIADLHEMRLWHDLLFPAPYTTSLSCPPTATTHAKPVEHSAPLQSWHRRTGKARPLQLRQPRPRFERGGRQICCELHAIAVAHFLRRLTDLGYLKLQRRPLRLFAVDDVTAPRTPLHPPSL